MVLRPAAPARSASSPARRTRGCWTGRPPRRGSPSRPGSRPRGDRLWLADAETSSLRYLEAGAVTTAVGTGLFDFGHVDGPAAQALLQHPLGVTALPDGSVAVSDTYNGAVRRYDPAAGTVTTLLTGLAEPSDAVVLDGDLVVVESAAHRLTRVRLPDEALVVDGIAQRTHRPVTEVRPGTVELEVVFTPPAGQKLDERGGPATRLVVSSTPPGLLRDGEGRGEGLTRTLVLDGHVGDGVLHVAAMAASCDDATAASSPPATCTSRTGASRSAWSTAPPPSSASTSPADPAADAQPHPQTRRNPAGDMRMTACSGSRAVARDALDRTAVHVGVGVGIGPSGVGRGRGRWAGCGLAGVPGTVHVVGVPLVGAVVVRRAARGGAASAAGA